MTNTLEMTFIIVIYVFPKDVENRDVYVHIYILDHSQA
jgi:hypothetical protein